MAINYTPDRGVVVASSISALYVDGEVFPYLPGEDFVVTKAPNWSTGIAQAANGSEVRAQYWAGPIYNFKVQFNVLRDADQAVNISLGSELQQLIAFFNGRAGRYGFFYYYDPNDNQIQASQAFGTGDGSTKIFQLIRTVAPLTPWATTEPVYALLNPPTVKVAGTVKTYNTDYTISPWGIITFTSAPASGAALTWTGQFLFVCRFDQDKMELQQLAYDLWGQNGLSFIGITPG